jgi:hypothetical protein
MEVDHMEAAPLFLEPHLLCGDDQLHRAPAVWGDVERRQCGLRHEARHELQGQNRDRYAHEFHGNRPSAAVNEFRATQKY